MSDEWDVKAWEAWRDGGMVAHTRKHLAYLTDRWLNGLGRTPCVCRARNAACTRVCTNSLGRERCPCNDVADKCNRYCIIQWEKDFLELHTTPLNKRGQKNE